MLDDVLPVETDSPEATQAMGKLLGSRLQSGAIVALYGDLGAGKTLFVRGICEGLGLDPDVVSSPTFTLINEYRGGSLDVFHFDTYRLKKLSDFFSLGYEDYFFGSGVTVIEWPEKIEDLLPVSAIRISLMHAGPERRRIEERDAE